MIGLSQDRPEFFVSVIDVESDGDALRVKLIVKARSENQAERRAEVVSRIQEGILLDFDPKGFIAIDSEVKSGQSKNIIKEYKVTVVNQDWIRKNLD